ncbi:hypothetical protein CCHR01_18987 [Colletotrichum chrysophilum]|uniref:Uncharacterized protein n=1 Tax=Colletotrichum chrysophilum TaxID=1836956 RepID=A0AAD8ZZB2_9PEZI|nr:hypothetical protein CCHR01_18987 [Colletotrichum chrysophilum]
MTAAFCLASAATTSTCTVSWSGSSKTQPRANVPCVVRNSSGRTRSPRLESSDSLRIDFSLEFWRFVLREKVEIPKSGDKEGRFASTGRLRYEAIA